MTSGDARPVMVDAHERVSDVLVAFREELLRSSFRGESIEVVLGARRAAERFPASSRFSTGRLVDWENRTKATMWAPDAFTVLFDPSFASLMPYAVVPVQTFGRPLSTAISEIERRLQLDSGGFALLWMGSGGYVTPLHHDGRMVHGRWHLVVRGTKQFDFVPPRSQHVPQLEWWDLYRRFSALYTSPVPDAWLSDGTGAERFELKPGQMVTWERGWWHRVEIARSGTSIGLSTRGHVPAVTRRKATAHWIATKVIGDIEHYVDAQVAPPWRTPEELAALTE